MTTPASRFSNSIPTLSDSSSNGHGVDNRIGQIPRDDVLQYIHEMCVTLAYMSITYRCERVADLLSAAAVEAEHSIAASDRPTL